MTILLFRLPVQDMSKQSLLSPEAVLESGKTGCPSDLHYKQHWPYSAQETAGKLICPKRKNPKKNKIQERKKQKGKS